MTDADPLSENPPRDEAAPAPGAPGAVSRGERDALPLPPIPPALEKILPRVQTPGQYVGGELNAIVKPADAVRLRMALAFPDTYAVGMSHHGSQILYALVNAVDHWACERAYCPLPDMEAELRAASLPLMTLETFTPLSDCDAVGFSLSYELCGTALLTMLDLGGVPLLAAERGPGDPFVFAGGHAALNPEPFADFVDCFLIGEAESSLSETLRILEDAGGRAAPDREAVLLRIAREVKGAYVPSLYALETTPAGRLVPVPPRSAADDDPEASALPPYPVARRVEHAFDRLPVPTRPVVPTVQTVHERVILEIMRGCPNGCRFCQAGYICRPVRSRRVDDLLDAAREAIDATGYDEIGLLSLSTSNYPHFDELVARLDAEFAPRGVSLSLPSLRVDHALSGIPERFRTVRKSGFTIAPEAGADPLRAAINKDVTDENLLAACAEAYRQGWQSIKLYFMIGLPGETAEDVAAIADLANRIAALREKGPKKKPAVTLSVSNFIPKPHTPLQWDAMDSPESLTAKQKVIASRVDRRRVTYKAHDVATSFLEAVIAKGDRRVGKVIREAWARGARLDGWSDYFRPLIWEEAFAHIGINPAAIAGKDISPEESLPWDVIDNGIRRAFLLSERDKMRTHTRTLMCSDEHCPGCGLERCPQRDPVI